MPQSLLISAEPPQRGTPARSSMPSGIVLYDADCGFCRWSLGKLLAWDRRRLLRPVALQDPEAEAPAGGHERGGEVGLLAPGHAGRRGPVRRSGAGPAPPHAARRPPARGHRGADTAADRPRLPVCRRAPDGVRPSRVLGRQAAGGPADRGTQPPRVPWSRSRSRPAADGRRSSSRRLGAAQARASRTPRAGPPARRAIASAPRKSAGWPAISSRPASMMWVAGSIGGDRVAPSRPSSSRGT